MHHMNHTNNSETLHEQLDTTETEHQNLCAGAVNYSEEVMRIHKFQNKYQHLLDTHHTNKTKNFEVLQEQLDRTKTECIISSEKRCRKLSAGAVDYSEEVFT